MTGQVGAGKKTLAGSVLFPSPQVHCSLLLILLFQIAQDCCLRHLFVEFIQREAAGDHAVARAVGTFAERPADPAAASTPASKAAPLEAKLFQRRKVRELTQEELSLFGW